MRLILFVIGYVAVTATPAFAYSDPGSGLLIFQILGSVLVGAMFYFKKIRDWVLKRLGIRTNNEQR